jgi:hypothetical protein
VSRTWGTHTLCDTHAGLVVEPQNYHVLWMADFAKFKPQNLTEAVSKGTAGSTWHLSEGFVKTKQPRVEFVDVGSKI